MDFVPPNLNISKLRRKMDIRNLTLHIAGDNHVKNGRLYVLWRDGNYLVIQAEPYTRPGINYEEDLPISHTREDMRALHHLKEVIQAMLDTISFDGEHNWAHLVRQKDGMYRLVYTKKRLVDNCPIWTKVVELDNIEVTRILNGLYWEGIYDGKEVDIFIAWSDCCGAYITAESRGQKLIQSLRLGHYFFEILAHVSKNGNIVGLMTEPLVGRAVTYADRAAVYAALADIQRHGIVFTFQLLDIFITHGGVKFASVSSAKYYRDQDALAKAAEKYFWGPLAEIFDNFDNNPFKGLLGCSRSILSTTCIIPRLPSPGKPIALTHEEAVIRWVWSITQSEEVLRVQITAYAPLHRLYQSSNSSSKSSSIRHNKRIKGDKRALISPEDHVGLLAKPTARIESMEEPLAVEKVVRQQPYARPSSKRLVLPKE